MELDFSPTTPWAIQPEKLIELNAYKTRCALPPTIRADRSPLSYEAINGVAVLPLSGVLAKHMTPLLSFFGGTSTEMAGRLFDHALNEPGVESIALMIDSPGGTVDGTQTLANKILAARGKKPITAFADGNMCSAAYWIGASADRIYATSGVAQIGSIGVVSSHIDVSGMQAQRGIKTTEVAAGKYKRIASNYAPLSEEGRADIQSTVDYLYSLFVQHVATARRATEQVVLNTMADGRVFIGQQAVSAGLVDGIMTFDNFLKGNKTMENRTHQDGANAWASDREALHAKAKQYQESHPGIDYSGAIAAVVGEIRVAAGRAIASDSEKLRGWNGHG